MTFADSHLGRVRAAVGSQLLLVPGATTVLMRTDGRILMTLRADNRTWCFPGGMAEPGGSFARTAIRELQEETAVTVDEGDLIPFATFSEAERHTVTYPNGDVVHGFALCYLVTRWSGEPTADGVETLEMRFVEPKRPPGPLYEPTTRVLELFMAFRATGAFQAR